MDWELGTGYPLSKRKMKTKNHTADILGGKGVLATVGPLLMGREKMEISGVTLKNPGILARAGVKVAIQADGSSDTKWLPLHAGLAVREGMDEAEAFRAVTLNPAEILGVAAWRRERMPILRSFPAIPFSPIQSVNRLLSTGNGSIKGNPIPAKKLAV